MLNHQRRKKIIYSQHTFPSSLVPNNNVITSYGIIAVRTHIEKTYTGPVVNNVIPVCAICSMKTNDVKNLYSYQRETDSLHSILLIQRRHTNAYLDIVFGRYNSVLLLPYLVSELTCKEKSNLITWPFMQLWRHVNLWRGSHDTSTFKQAFISSEYWKLSHKFYENFVRMSHLIRNNRNHNICSEFGFPKGRKEKNETGIQCALREFCEETGIAKSKVKMLTTKQGIMEEFIGSDNQIYRHIYYLATIPEETAITLSLNQNDRKQLCEISNLGWYPYDVAQSTFRSYDQTKLHVLYEAKVMLENFQINLSDKLVIDELLNDLSNS